MNRPATRYVILEVHPDTPTTAYLERHGVTIDLVPDGSLAIVDRGRNRISVQNLQLDAAGSVFLIAKQWPLKWDTVAVAGDIDVDLPPLGPGVFHTNDPARFAFPALMQGERVTDQ